MLRVLFENDASAGLPSVRKKTQPCCRTDQQGPVPAALPLDNCLLCRNGCGKWWLHIVLFYTRGAFLAITPKHNYGLDKTTSACPKIMTDCLLRRVTSHAFDSKIKLMSQSFFFLTQVLLKEQHMEHIHSYLTSFKCHLCPSSGFFCSVIKNVIVFFPIFPSFLATDWSVFYFNVGCFSSRLKLQHFPATFWTRTRAAVGVFAIWGRHYRKDSMYCKTGAKPSAKVQTLCSTGFRADDGGGGFLDGCICLPPK